MLLSLFKKEVKQPIKTNASGANAAFATGENAVINVSNKLPQLEIHHVV